MSSIQENWVSEKCLRKVYLKCSSTITLVEHLNRSSYHRKSCTQSVPAAMQFLVCQEQFLICASYKYYYTALLSILCHPGKIVLPLYQRRGWCGGGEVSTVAVVECWSCSGLDESTAAATGGYIHWPHWPLLATHSTERASGCFQGQNRDYPNCWNVF